MNQTVFSEAFRILRQTYGADATFREGQYEAIEATMTRHRTLVVQKTGWGKSLVYFVCTKMNRNRGRGMTLVISPLLVLMENQMDFARRMGLRCEALNSSVKDASQRASILLRMKSDQIDMLFTTPETLMKDELQSILPGVRIGLFVIDEAHCISDWGHDFRLEYSQLGRVISGFSSNVPVLATTATANDRVVEDLKKQLGNNVFVSRGPLTRPSLHIQVLRLETKVERYAWLLENLPKLPGTGIVYCITTRDCDHLADFLNRSGIPARPYHSRGSEDADAEAISLFAGNRIKVIVATTKLGMGYDKGDVAFVIHYQSPASIVAWYQQIGRAGRSLRDAYVFLMNGREDDDINNYFINTAFPSPDESAEVMRVIESGSGLSKREIESQVNLRRSRIENTIRFLENEGFIRHDYVNSCQRWFLTPKQYVYNKAHYDAIVEIRRRELDQMHDLMRTSVCLSRFAVNALDDHSAQDCGRCANCTGRDILPGLSLSKDSLEKASDFINASLLTIEPRKVWPDGKKVSHLLQPGICLCKYGDPGWGAMVKRGKYPQQGAPKRFDDQLVVRATQALSPLAAEKGVRHITFVPSLRSELVRDFTRRLAAQMHLAFVDLLEKSSAPPQKDMENSVYQCSNAMASFTARDVPLPEKVILVDDVVDSRWTLTVCGYKMMERGCREVFPFALADSQHEERSS